MTLQLWLELAALILAVIALCGLFSVRRTRNEAARRLRLSGEAFGTNLIVSLPLAIIGWATGYLTGLSREPAAAAAIPAILTLAGALFAYVSLKRLADAPFLALGLSTFAIVVVLSTAYYSGVRERERFVRLLLLSDEERIVRNRRANIDLPEDIPNWITGDQPGSK